MKKYRVLHVRLDNNMIDVHQVAKRPIIHHADKTYNVGGLYYIHRKLYRILEEIPAVDNGGNDASV